MTDQILNNLSSIDIATLIAAITGVVTCLFTVAIYRRPHPTVNEEEFVRQSNITAHIAHDIHTDAERIHETEEKVHKESMIKCMSPAIGKVVAQNVKINVGERDTCH